MELAYLNRILLTCFVMWALSNTATASTESDFLNILICMPTEGPNANDHFVALMKRSRALNRDGPYLFSGPLRREEICIKNATFGAAFGVVAADGEVCSNYRALIKKIVARRPQLVRSEAGNEPGMIAVFKDSKYEVRVFHGASADMQPPKPDPLSKKISYACEQKFSGPQ